MHTTACRAAALPFALCTLLLAAPRPAQAETVSTCVGYIDSVPATITTQGTWCMRKDLSTAIASGAAITVSVNNVIIDCNDFKLGGLAAGPDTTAFGIRTIDRINVRVRNCAIRGFRQGLYLRGAGHSVVDSRFDNNTRSGVNIEGDGLQILRNTVRDTGGATNDTVAGILARGDGVVRDNQVHRVFADGLHWGYGILAYMEMGTVAGNSVAGVQGGASASMASRGISNQQQLSNAILADNYVSFNPAQTSGWGIGCSGAVAARNTVHGHTTGVYGDCVNGGGNFSNP
jgi:hypothetical protein